MESRANLEEFYQVMQEKSWMVMQEESRANLEEFYQVKQEKS